MDVLEIYADADGETHFRRITVDFETRDFAPPSPAIGVSAETATQGSVFIALPPGWDTSFHPTPYRQFATMVDGALTIETTDGEIVPVEPGMVVLLNDADSKGHLSQVQGERPAHFLMVAIAE